MNMKKTIAGVMAGAMAVSAMATMVSADQDSISLTYDLKRYETDKNATKAQIQFVINYTNGASDYGFTSANDKITVGVNKGTWFNDEVTGELHDVEVAFTSLKNKLTDTGSVTVTQKWVNSGANDAGDFIIKNYTPVSLGGKDFTIKLDKKGDSPAADTLNISGFDNEKLGQSESAFDFSFQSGVIKLNYEVPATVYTNIAEGDMSFGWNGKTVLEWLGVDPKGDKTLGQKELMEGVTANVSGITGAAQPIAVGAFKAGASEDKIYPLKSSLTNPANVTKALTERKAGGKYYTNPVAVLNDAIANNENVVFEFRSYNGYVATAKSKLFGGDWIEVDRAYGWQVNSQDWYNPTFGQHLYTNLDNSYSLMGSTEFDMFGSYSAAWAQNLFTGAIVVNSGLTMQLSDTDKFNWGADTLSFDWFTITDEGKVTEAKTFLTKMLLYTPVDWYWDTLTVTVGNLEEDDIVPGEGAEGDGDEITDDGDEIVIDPIDEVDEPAVVDEPVVTEAPVTEAVAPVEPVQSPKTGNAPVALAVIPVALAAAAVVAKKRG
ncbi:MAG: hypothetical protein K2K57_09875 [Oscillospiraceae bacterium]|nr:hypothetical protein [Oscillospiraceae bacterium]